MPALSGVKVICVGQFYFAPYCSMLLARLGADVIKIESPQGDPYRRLPTADRDGTSVQFTMLNSGKRAMRLDLKNPKGRDIVRKLAGQADILIQNLSPGAMDRFGLGYDALHEINPRLIMASGTGFGSFGPYAGESAMDLTIQARTAIMSTTGFMDGPPVRTGPSVVDFMAGTHMLSGILAALYQRERTGRGQHVEVSLQDSILPALSSNIAGMINSKGTMPERTGNRHGGLAVVPYNAYRTTDGWVTVLCPTQTHWERLCEVMDDPEAKDDRYSTMHGRCAHSDEVDVLVERWTSTHTKREVAKLLANTAIPTAPVLGLAELMDDPHVAERGILRWMDDESGEWLTLGSPLFLSDSPMVEPDRAHGLGADTDSILMNELGMSEHEVAELRLAGAI
ncbi:CoA transferase [Rhodococcus sp. 06-156-3C]|uniref:CaiB/BaiF CoA transferase family protein n=1 Tax=Nocardiaceae TaxID=85025 RepID=UPI0005230C6C|nr:MULTISPECIES: CoA transferase [Rhodococcus]OZD13138.1 CoA transferase [Rhodococcus sp. 06-156-4a]OZD17990.1 CoA transferase [Rhodococcus sp. 06-156-3C]OZD20732.1 CoA transferase [Rhodococcus sp. 06-156-4C]OZD30566.1 CoA transferase [Rhodococcus sp. 06-156-3b]OZD32660.1 CoA transferase [Rhodococcus sp. 06-156-3]